MVVVSTEVVCMKQHISAKQLKCKCGKKAVRKCMVETYLVCGADTCREDGYCHWHHDKEESLK